MASSAARIEDILATTDGPDGPDGNWGDCSDVRRHDMSCGREETIARQLYG